MAEADAPLEPFPDDWERAQVGWVGLVGLVGHGGMVPRAPPAVQALAGSTRRRAMTLRHRVSSAPSKIDSTRASTK